MSDRLTLPFGAWPSPITAEMAASAGVELGQTAIESGVAYWIEGRPAEAGRSVLVRGTPYTEPEDVIPPGFDVRTRVHEYGGGAYAVHDGVVFFTNFPDQRLYRQDGGADPVPITADTGAKHRFADGVVTANGEIWIGVRERHDLGPRVADVVNELVAIPTDGNAEPRVIASGRDFYATPRISPDGHRLSYLTWDLPWMPWNGCELFVADLTADGTLSNATHVAGVPAEESIFQPEWSPRGDLVFASDRSGWWNLERIRGDQRTALHPAEAEFGYPQWVFGERAFGFLGDGRIACHYDRDGRTALAVLDSESGELLDLDLPHDALEYGPSVVTEGSVILFAAGSATIPKQIVWLDFGARSVEVLRTSTDLAVGDAYISVPRAIEFPTERGRTSHALHYPPTNPEVVSPPGERPPGIVMSHGGPTGNTTSMFDLEIQFWTSRGFAVIDVNYGGSTGYGHAYRERLNGQWGVVDLEDCVNAAKQLAAEGEVDGDRLLIRGGSAGGYTTLCALTYGPPVFAAGTSYYGIGDLVPFATGETHKFESTYEHTLVGPWPQAESLYRERSPINHVEKISTPMLLLQGADDDVVPPSQAELMVAALRAATLPYAYVLFEGEGHGFRRADTVERSLEAELSFYCQILGIDRDDVPRLEIENLPE